VEHFHLVDHLVTIAQIEILFEQILSLQVIRILASISHNLFTLSQHQPSFLQHANLSARNSKSILWGGFLFKVSECLL
jgi:hypothetical protein